MTQQHTGAWRAGDLFRWSFKRPPEHSPYHCCSQIAEFNGQYLRDTYWHDSTSGRHWTQDEAESRLELRYIGNRGGLEKKDASAYFYYRTEDIVDLRHPNNMDDRDVWVRIGAERSQQVMKEHAQYCLERAKNDAESAARRIERCREDLAAIENGNLHIYLVSP